MARSQRPVEVNWSSCDLITDTLHNRPSDRRPELDARRNRDSNLQQISWLMAHAGGDTK